MSPGNPGTSQKPDQAGKSFDFSNLVDEVSQGSHGNRGQPRTAVARAQQPSWTLTFQHYV
jgi:hypothetical protein